MIGFDAKGTMTMARLDRLSVEGFRSIRKLDAFSLTNKNLLIGANGSGKSNFLELFKFVRAFMQLPLPGIQNADIKKYVLDAGTATDLLHKGKLVSEQISITMHFGLNGYKLSLVPTQDDLLRIESEFMFYSGTGKWYPLYSGDGFTPGLLAKKDTPGVLSEHGVGYYIYTSIKNWQMYHFHDTGRLSPAKRTAIGTTRGPMWWTARFPSGTRLVSRLCCWIACGMCRSHPMSGRPRGSCLSRSSVGAGRSFTGSPIWISRRPFSAARA